MIEFPETAQAEWQIAATAANAEVEIRKKIEQQTLVEKQVERLRINHLAKLAFEAELAAENTPELEMMTLDEYVNNPAAAGPSDLIDGVLKSEGLCLMLGPSQSGKSTLALQSLRCLLTGEDFLTQDVTKIDGAVGALSYDMPGSLMMDWMAGFPGIDRSKVSVVNAYKQGNPLAVPAHRKKIADTWRKMGVEVILIDSFSASFFGSDQNDAAQSMAHYRDLKAFALSECGAKAVIVIVHSTESSPKKPRGSTVHQDVADSIVTVWMPNGPASNRHVEMAKYRQHRGANNTMTHQMNPVVISKPDDVTHLVDVDTGGMTHAGMELHPKFAAAHFAALPPEGNEEPDVAVSLIDTEEDEDL